mgnify:CR=1 FL=1
MNQTTLLIVILLLAFVLCACGEDDVWPRTNFELQSGEVVSCRWVEESGCGVDLWDCSNGKEYSCQTGVVEL